MKIAYIVPTVECYYNFQKGIQYPVVKMLGNAIYVYDDFDELTIINMEEMSKSFALYWK